MKQTNTISTDPRMHITRLIGGIRISRSRAWFLLVAALFAATAMVLATESLDRRPAANTIAAITPAPLSEPPVVTTPQEKIRAELVTAFPFGFEPEQLIRTEGAFVLCVDNRAGTEALSMQLISRTNGPVYTQPIHKGQSTTHKLLNLAPGQYVLTESSHPKWQCTITVTPR